MKKVKIEKEIFGENAILIEAILNGLIVKNRKKEKENKKKWKKNNMNGLNVKNVKEKVSDKRWC